MQHFANMKADLGLVFGRQGSKKTSASPLENASEKRINARRAARPLRDHSASRFGGINSHSSPKLKYIYQDLASSSPLHKPSSEITPIVSPLVQLARVPPPPPPIPPNFVANPAPVPPPLPPTFGGNFPNTFNPRKEANLPHREKVNKWIANVPAYPSPLDKVWFNDCYSALDPLTDAVDDPEANRFDFSETSDVLQYQSRLITLLVNRVYWREPEKIREPSCLDLLEEELSDNPFEADDVRTTKCYMEAEDVFQIPDSEEEIRL